jgi:hypothetical protein
MIDDEQPTDYGLDPPAIAEPMKRVYPVAKPEISFINREGSRQERPLLKVYEMPSDLLEQSRYRQGMYRVIIEEDQFAVLELANRDVLREIQGQSPDKLVFYRLVGSLTVNEQGGTIEPLVLPLQEVKEHYDPLYVTPLHATIFRTESQSTYLIMPTHDNGGYLLLYSNPQRSIEMRVEQARRIRSVCGIPSNKRFDVNIDPRLDGLDGLDERIYDLAKEPGLGMSIAFSFREVPRKGSPSPIITEPVTYFRSQPDQAELRGLMRPAEFAKLERMIRTN